MTAPTRWLTSEQLGPHFDDGGEIALVEVLDQYRRRPVHRQKAHLHLSALRHRAAELGDRARVISGPTHREALEGAGLTGDRLETVGAISWGMRRLVDELGGTMLAPRGFVTERAVFDDWAAGKKASQLVMDRFYREVRERTGLLMEGGQPVGGQFSFDADNRERPPKGAVSLGLPDPWRPAEDDIDQAVREDLDRLAADGAPFIGVDAPRRFAATREEALAALDDFIETRLNDFGPYEDAMLRGDAIMAHTRLSVPINLGLLHPLEVVKRVVAEYGAGNAPLNSVEGLVRQLIGWRDWVWHLYWHLGPDYTTGNNFLDARTPVPEDWWRPDPSTVAAACLSDALEQVAQTGWTHHIIRLMVLGNHALQRGYDPAELTAWFRDAFVDGTAWVMPANVVGMSQFADEGVVATKPYASGGAYIQKMSDYCGSCRFDPKKRLGDDACPFTAGYWAFLDRVEPRIRGNHRMAQPLAGLRRLADREQVVAQERARDAY